jgi:outer membrane protein TolC
MRLAFALSALAIATTARAQPGQQPPQPPEQTGDNPSWLPGVQEVTAEETAVPGKVTLSMPRAVEIALKQSPNVRIQRASYDAAVGRVMQARLPLQPLVTLSASANAGSQQVRPCNFMDPNSPTCGGFFTSGYSLPFIASAKWTFWDFGLTRANTKAAQLNADAQKATIDTTGLDTRQSVELAYLSAIAQHRLVIVAQATVTSETAHLDQAKRFVAAQAQDPIVVSQAQSRYQNARAALAQAQSAEANALAALRAAVGYIDPTRQLVIDPNWPTSSDEEPPELPGLVDQARKLRPEIRALQLQIDAAQASLDAAHYERRPTLSALATVQWDPQSGSWSPQPFWTAGVSLTWLAWDGGKSRADVHVAKANFDSAVATRDNLLVTLTATLEGDRAQILTQRAAVLASQEAVKSAKEQLRLAEARYVQGLGSQIELADAQTAVTTAEGNLVSSEWNLANAWASLRRQIGV